MGLLGEYIDALPDEEKDRVIRAQDWGTVHRGATAEFVDVLDHVESRAARRPSLRERIRGLRMRMWRVITFGALSRRRIRRRFVRAIRRVGEERLVHLLKRRAGRWNLLQEGGRHPELR